MLCKYHTNHRENFLIINQFRISYLSQPPAFPQFGFPTRDFPPHQHHPRPPQPSRTRSVLPPAQPPTRNRSEVNKFNGIKELRPQTLVSPSFFMASSASAISLEEAW